LICDDGGVDVPVHGGRLLTEVSRVRGKDDACRRIVFEGHAHAAAVHHDLQESTGVVDKFAVNLHEDVSIFVEL
jgi:kynureninase